MSELRQEYMKKFAKAKDSLETELDLLENNLVSVFCAHSKCHIGIQIPRCISISDESGLRRILLSVMRSTLQLWLAEKRVSQGISGQESN